MSKEVKRFTIGTFHAAIVSAGSECVLAADYDALLAERDALRDALNQAAQSLESISKLEGYVAGYDACSHCMSNVKDYARSRARVALAALQGEQP